ncbi:MAG: type II toxin-antitoxin system RelE/ParE family toxin [Lachnospiraceae bacterium]|nr:type II toxin-antitoxin system RelE/ParE family toxin [Lachnospiraceae bacterium]
MAYKLNITDQANDLLDNIVFYLVFRLHTKQGAEHLLNELDVIYERLKENPKQFPLSRDLFLARRGYHEAIVSGMNYLVVFSISNDTVNIVGIFHQLEDYSKKI